MSDVTAMALDRFDTAPAYTGLVYSDNTAAAAGDPPAPPPVTTTLPTWRNLYDWPNGHGYAGWHYATSATDSRYGSDTNQGGNYGLWLWPVGGQQYTPNYAEWTYTAPGTTRISTVNLTFAYRNKFLAHHCLEVGLRTLDGTIVSQDTWCKPALPPDSQRDVQVKLADPNNNPTAKVLFFRVEFPACADPSSPSCSKYIPQLDPLTMGANARLKLADMILVDDDNPLLQPTGPLWDIRDHFIDGTQTYPVTLGSAELGSGIVSSAFSHTSTYPPATDSLGAQNAPCDAAHNTPPLDDRICPATFSWDTSVPTPPYPEGPNAFTETATDNAGNVGSRSWTIYIDRTAPDGVVASGALYDLGGGYTNGSGAAGLGIHAHDPGRDVQKASGIASVSVDDRGATLASATDSACNAMICPDTLDGSIAVDLGALAEGTHVLTAHATDLVGHSRTGQTWSFAVDRSGPTAPTDITLLQFVPDEQLGEVGFTPGGDPALADGTPGVGFGGVQFRVNVAGSGWTDWQSSNGTTLWFAGGTSDDQLQIEIRERDSLGNVGPVASATLRLVATDLPEPLALPTADDTAVDTLASDFGLSAAEAAVRIDRQPAEEDMAQYLSTTNGFVGMWIDQSNGGTIDVATTVPGITSGIAASFGLPESLVHEVLVTRTLDDLTAIQDDVEAQISALPNPAVAPATWIDTENARVLVTVVNPLDSSLQGLLSHLAATYGAAVASELDATPEAFSACTAQDCPPPLRGGLALVGKIIFNGNPFTSFCTSGFTAKSQTGVDYLLTAAHCETATFYHHGKKIGATTARAYGGAAGADIQAIKIASPLTWGPTNTIFRSTSVPDFAITSLESSVVVGTYLCHSGAVSGTTCGKVIHTHFRVRGPDPLTGQTIVLKNLNEVAGPSTCAMAGDSGGPAFDPAHHRAYGLVSIGTPCGGRGKWSFIPLRDALAAIEDDLGPLTVTG